MDKKEFEEAKNRDGYVLNESMHYYTDWETYKKYHPHTAK